LKRFKELLTYLIDKKYIYTEESNINLEDRTARCLISPKNALNLKRLNIDENIYKYFNEIAVKYYYDDCLEVIEEEGYIVTEGDRYKSERNFQLTLTFIGIFFTAVITYYISAKVPMTITYRDSSSFPHYNIENLELKSVTVNALRVRETPSLDSSVINLLNAGEIIRVQTSKEEWTKIYYSREGIMYNGWVSSKFLK